MFRAIVLVSLLARGHGIDAPNGGEECAASTAALSDEDDNFMLLQTNTHHSELQARGMAKASIESTKSQVSVDVDLDQSLLAKPKQNKSGEVEQSTKGEGKTDDKKPVTSEPKPKKSGEVEQSTRGKGKKSDKKPVTSESKPVTSEPKSKKSGEVEQSTRGKGKKGDKKLVTSESKPVASDSMIPGCPNLPDPLSAGADGGGLVDYEEPTDEFRKLMTAADTKTKLGTENYEPCFYSTQVVAGINYKVVVHLPDVTDGSSLKVVTIHKGIDDVPPVIQSVSEYRYDNPQLLQANAHAELHARTIAKVSKESTKSQVSVDVDLDQSLLAKPQPKKSGEVEQSTNTSEPKPKKSGELEHSTKGKGTHSELVQSVREYTVEST